jgi:hypothetical protein
MINVGGDFLFTYQIGETDFANASSFFFVPYQSPGDLLFLTAVP